MSERLKALGRRLSEKGYAVSLFAACLLPGGREHVRFLLEQDRAFNTGRAVGLSDTEIAEVIIEWRTEDWAEIRDAIVRRALGVEWRRP